MSDKYINGTGLGALRTWVLGKLGLKQDTLVSGTNIKTVNNTSLLGSGNISISGGLQNLVDGSATGSIRGIFTTMETPQYTIGEYAFAEGRYTAASGKYSHAEGDSTLASGSGSHAEGSSSIARGGCSHAEGEAAIANGNYSHAQNRATIAAKDAQTVIGKYNIEDTETIAAEQKAFIIGNGTSDNDRSNALTVDWRGNVDIASGASYKINGIPLSASDVGALTTSDLATDTTAGVIKLNPSESVTLNSNGQLDVGGRLGQMSNTTGVYSPKTINPQSVGNGSFLLTEASGLKLGTKSLAVVTGSGLTVKSAAAGTTTYLVTNSYENKIICAGIVGGILALNEATAAENYVNVTGVTIGGYAPNNAKYWTAEGDITITTDASINPNSSTTSVRPYCCSTGFSNFSAGQQSGSDGGASVVVGQKVKSASGNACAIVGASIYNTGNGNALFGRQHISRKNRSFLAGTGHDTTNGPSECVAAFGQWSDIKSDTSFVIGNGTSSVARSNSFEIDTAGDAFFNGYIVLKSPNGTQYKISVDNTGQLVTAAI